MQNQNIVDAVSGSSEIAASDRLPVVTWNKLAEEQCELLR